MATSSLSAVHDDTNKDVRLRRDRASISSILRSDTIDCIRSLDDKGRESMRERGEREREREHEVSKLGRLKKKEEDISSGWDQNKRREEKREKNSEQI
jgi:hypothetical protein